MPIDSPGSPVPKVDLRREAEQLAAKLHARECSVCSSTWIKGHGRIVDAITRDLLAFADRVRSQPPLASPACPGIFNDYTDERDHCAGCSHSPANTTVTGGRAPVGGASASLNGRESVQDHGAGNRSGRASSVDEREKRLREALEPFAAFARAFDAKPINGLADELYGIHAGTKHEAYLRLSDCRRAARALAEGGDD